MYYFIPHIPRPLGATAVAGLAIAGILFNSGRVEAQTRTHLVSPGDTLSAIADRYDVTLEQLRGWNDLQGDLIAEGRELVVCDRPSPRPADAPESNTATAQTQEPGPAPEARTYVVATSDTLSCIAARFGVSLEELAGANERLEARRIRPGQRLVIPARSGDRLATVDQHHVVTEGETLSEIAERNGVTVADMVGWNEGLDPERITVGQRLVLRTRRPRTESVGAPTCGRLVDGRQLPEHPAYVIRNPERSWATDETIEQLAAAFDEVLRRHPGANRVRVHDLSLEAGGPIDDHRSHQSGRDVDLIYYQRECPDRVCSLQHVLPRQMDLAPQWTLLEYWLRHGAAQRIFIDYGLQEVLYNYARRHGATRRELEAWFQYPRGWSADVGVIRHFPNHGDHVHVRFVCPEGDDHCQ